MLTRDGESDLSYADPTYHYSLNELAASGEHHYAVLL